MAGCELDGVLYHCLNSDDVSACSASVPVEFNDNGTEYKTRMVAGVVGIEASASNSTDSMLDGTEHDHPGQEASAPQGGIPELDTIQPVSGWWMYESKDD